jgi:hypothetical protein
MSSDCGAESLRRFCPTLLSLFFAKLEDDHREAYCMHVPLHCDESVPEPEIET